MSATIGQLKAEARRKAINSLARYKFVMFGYWAGVWVHLNRLDPAHEPSPFTSFVELAREINTKGD